METAVDACLVLLVLVAIIFVALAAGAIADFARIVGGVQDASQLAAPTAGWAAAFLADAEYVRSSGPITLCADQPCLPRIACVGVAIALRHGQLRRRVTARPRSKFTHLGFDLVNEAEVASYADLILVGTVVEEIGPNDDQTMFAVAVDQWIKGKPVRFSTTCDIV